MEPRLLPWLDTVESRGTMHRTYVVTGSASGIGRATVELLRRQGAKVIGVDLRSADVAADLSTPQGRADAVDGILIEAGRRLDAVIANAGLSVPSARTVAVNYFGAVELLEALRPALAAGRHPRAVVTSSMATLMPVHDDLVEACLAGDEDAALGIARGLEAGEAQGAIYPSSKRALSRWVRRQAPTQRWAGCGIPLNAVAPGIVDTPMVADLFATPESAAAVDEMVPMPLGGHMAAEDAARLLVWMASEENTHVCGQTIYVDGGSDAVLRGDDVWSWHDPVSTAG
ncbi:SDR family oxidoreductase [Fodinibacter luteus]|uniref:SDR family oxidoreductase n=1 Tax=Fodinibacter luteus TaxID=552064 RepID=UPI0031E5B0CD